MGKTKYQKRNKERAAVLRRQREAEVQGKFVIPYKFHTTESRGRGRPRKCRTNEKRLQRLRSIDLLGNSEHRGADIDDQSFAFPMDYDDHSVGHYDNEDSDNDGMDKPCTPPQLPLLPIDDVDGSSYSNNEKRKQKQAALSNQPPTHCGAAEDVDVEPEVDNVLSTSISPENIGQDVIRIQDYVRGMQNVADCMESFFQNNLTEAEKEEFRRNPSPSFGGDEDDLDVKEDDKHETVSEGGGSMGDEEFGQERDNHEDDHDEEVGKDRDDHDEEAEEEEVVHVDDMNEDESDVDEELEGDGGQYEEEIEDDQVEQEDEVGLGEVDQVDVEVEEPLPGRPGKSKAVLKCPTCPKRNTNYTTSGGFRSHRLYCKKRRERQEAEV